MRKPLIFLVFVMMSIFLKKPSSRRENIFFFSVTATLVLVGLAGSAAWFRYPPWAARWLAQATGKPVFLPSFKGLEQRVERSQWPQSAAVIPKEATEPLKATTLVGRIDELRARPTLLIEGASLIFDAASPQRIVTSTLILRNANLYAQGKDILIDVETLISSNSEIRSFYPSEGTAVQGPGLPGAKITLIVRGVMTGALRIDLAGQNGAPGKSGKPGVPGLAGAPGAPAHSGEETCLSRAQNGGDGGPGGPGGEGGAGDDGGAGGELLVKARFPNQLHERIEFSALGGAPGRPGSGGPGGVGGPGGQGGAPVGFCLGQGETGPVGLTGSAGKPGVSGVTGSEGKARFQPLASND